MTVEPTATQDKQITIDVPEDRVAEFYAFYGQFLAGFPGRRRGGPGRRGHRGPHGRHCHHPHHDEERAAEPGAEPSGPETTIV